VPPKKINPKIQVWIDARKRHRLSHAHIQMARELGLNPAKFGKLDNHRQEPWKAPLAEFIEDLYQKRFGKPQPDVVVSMEEKARLEAAKKAARREAKLVRREAAASLELDREEEKCAALPQRNPGSDRTTGGLT
jgi:hypothetical protein